MKTCKTCKHGRRDLLLGWSYGRCYANMKPSPVDGKMSAPARQCKYCEVSRAYPHDDSCGPDGRWHEPHEPSRVVVWLRSLVSHE